MHKKSSVLYMVPHQKRILAPDLGHGWARAVSQYNPELLSVSARPNSCLRCLKPTDIRLLSRLAAGNRGVRLAKSPQGPSR